MCRCASTVAAALLVAVAVAGNSGGRVRHTNRRGSTTQRVGETLTNVTLRAVAPARIYIWLDAPAIVQARLLVAAAAHAQPAAFPAGRPRPFAGGGDRHRSPWVTQPELQAIWAVAGAPARAVLPDPAAFTAAACEALAFGAAGGVPAGVGVAAAAGLAAGAAGIDHYCAFHCRSHVPLVVGAYHDHGDALFALTTVQTHRDWGIGAGACPAVVVGQWPNNRPWVRCAGY